LANTQANGGNQYNLLPLVLMLVKVVKVLRHLLVVSMLVRQGKVMLL
jgi:hypothetical protein